MGQMVLQYARKPSLLRDTSSPEWHMGCQQSRLRGAFLPFRFWVYSRLVIKKPRGFLKSKFLIDIGSHYLQDCDDTAFDFGPPRGLFVLILTAVRYHRDFLCFLRCLLSLLQYEKVVRSYKTGTYVSSGDFRAKSCNYWIKQYNKNFDKKTADWWKAILQYYVVESNSEHEEIGDMSILDEERAALPMSSSP